MPKGKHGNHRRGSSHPRWNKKQIISTEGYVKLRVGVNHPLSDKNGYAYEHLVVWVSSGRCLPGGNDVIHHVNQDKTDNRIENLTVMNRGIHIMQEHSSRGVDGRLKSIKKDKKASNCTLDNREWSQFPEVVR